jgi:hypothetical protein
MPCIGLRRTRVGVALVGVVATVGLAASPAFAASGTAALWHMDEAAGASTMVDSSGEGNDGRVPAGVTTGIAGAAGKAYHFDGRSLVRVPHDPSLNPGTAPITVSAWIRVPANLAKGDYNVVQKGVATTTGGAYKLEIHASTTTKFGFPACAFNGPTTAKNRVYGPVRINDGQWHRVECHLTATQAYAVVDGRSGPVAKRVVTSISNSTDVTLGGKPTDQHYFLGDLDEVSIRIG